MAPGVVKEERAAKEGDRETKRLTFAATLRSAAGIEADPESGSMVGIPGHTAVEWLASLSIGLTLTVRSYRALRARPWHHAPSGERCCIIRCWEIGEPEE
jgi:hypothetical protein